MHPASKMLLLVAALLVGFIPSGEDPKTSYTNKMKEVGQGSLPNLTLRMAETFLNTPYVAHTLEGNPTEQLVCRFDALDCTTLVDVAVSLAIARQKNLTYEEFLGVMTQLRYADATIDGYPSRQHYFLSWKNENQRIGLLTDITKNLGGVPYNKKIDFMSAHASLYEGINSGEVLARIKENERKINTEKYSYIPKASVQAIETRLKDGDIIGITSTVAGLDCNHQGIVKMQNNRAYLLHASTSAHKVILSKEPLSDYLNSIKRHSGIIVLRLKDTF
jgi:hypothetical protein